MTTRARPDHGPARVVAFLSAVVTVVVGLLGAGPASAAAIPAAQNAVGASTFAVPASVGASANITADQRLGEVGPGPGYVVATGVATKSAEESVTLYRHVSPAELADIGENGFRAGPNSLGGK